MTKAMWPLVVIYICIRSTTTLLGGGPITPADPASPASEFNILKYGAVADGKTMNTDAFRAAIKACSDADGGRVVVPSGTFLTGPIVLKSHVDLHVDDGALVLFSQKFDDYPLILLSYEGHDTVGCQSPISGDHLDHVSITGPGTFDAQGDYWRPLKKSKVTDEYWNKMVHSGGVLDDSGKTWYPSAAARDGDAALQQLRASTEPPRIADYIPYRDVLRPVLLLLSNSTNVTLDGPTFKNSPNWGLHLLLSDHINVHHITIDNPEYAQNGDGIDIDSCTDLTMRDSDVNAGDDGICLKSGRDEEGRRLGRPTEDITIDNCTVGHAHGGFVIGSEMSGGVRNVTVTHCTFHGTDAGLRFKSVRGRGGVVENIKVSDINMSDIKGAAITFDMYYFAKATATSQPVNEGTPIFRNFQISNITCQGAKQAIMLRGLPEMPISQITMDNVHISSDQGVSITDASDITLHNVHVECTVPPALEKDNVSGLKTDDFSADVQSK